ncbi:MAG TPA: hypothetical protein VL946_02840 [Lacibacter sp.]|jgi:hypothetical protein|nr:hypothetical protein [Lacibacter sp.]
MTSYYSLLLLIPASVVFLLIRYFVERNKEQVVLLFKTGLKEENTGRFEAAIKQYELALQEAEKKGFNKSLQLVISEKLKVLHTITEYEKEMCLTPKLCEMAPQAKV